MENQLGNNNSEQRLIGSGQPSVAARETMRRQQRGEAFVANNNEKRYLWTARAFATITAISLCCNVVLILAIMQVIPLFRVEPYLLSFQAKDEQVYNILPYQDDLAGHKSITEAFVRSYVLQRSTIVNDETEMEIRWLPGGPIQEMSSSAVYEEFVSKTANRALELVKERGLQREVNILTVNELGQGLWQVEYETRDMYPSSAAPELNYWTASLRVVYRKKAVKFNDRLNNPVGFTVVRYSLMRNKTK
ncbi:MAG: type IV secretion system protein [Alphaproteobacteria bacterium]|nr:type IV secretion system protein [Alphaproteobacteria bacterium]